MAEKVISGSLGTLKKAVQLALGPDLDSIKKDLGELKSEVRVINVKIDEMDKRHSTQIESIRAELRGLSEKVDLVRDVESLKVKVSALEKRR